jgi:hypothetical protein
MVIRMGIIRPYRLEAVPARRSANAEADSQTGSCGATRVGFSGFAPARVFRFDGHSFTNYTVRDGLPHPEASESRSATDCLLEFSSCQEVSQTGL